MRGCPRHRGRSRCAAHGGVAPTMRPAPQGRCGSRLLPGRRSRLAGGGSAVRGPSIRYSSVRPLAMGTSLQGVKGCLLGIARKPYNAVEVRFGVVVHDDVPSTRPDAVLGSPAVARMSASRPVRPGRVADLVESVAYERFLRRPVPRPRRRVSVWARRLGGRRQSSRPLRRGCLVNLAPHFIDLFLQRSRARRVELVAATLSASPRTSRWPRTPCATNRSVSPATSAASRTKASGARR